MSDNEQTDEQSVDTHGVPWSKVAPVVAVAGLVVLLLVVLASFSNNGDSASEPDSSAAPETATVSDVAPSATAEPTSVPTEAATVAPAEPTPPPTVTAVPQRTDCQRVNDNVETAAEAATAAIREELDAADDERCFVQDNADLRGGIYWMALNDGPIASGGALAIDGEPDGFKVVLFDLGPWNSYRRIGGNEGENASAIAGIPSGEIPATRGGYSVEVDGGAYLYGESPSSTFYWMTTSIFNSWVANGANNSLLGSPASSLYESDGVDRVDFEGGFITQSGTDVPTINSIRVDPAFLPANAEMQGRLISSRDGTGWFVDRQSRRWWIPNVQTWFCAGGDSNRVVVDAPGYAIHRLDLGGVASCPLGVTGTDPVEGGVEIQLYCELQVAAGSSAIELPDGWACESPTTQAVLAQVDVCIWQYGESAKVNVTEPPTAWTCTAA